MATYKLGSASSHGTVPAVCRRPLICERCFEALGTVVSRERLTGLTAGEVGVLWPQLRELVRQHDARCHEPTTVP